MILKSCAKLNLYLEVLGIRKDDYHNLKTLFERIDLADTITLTPRRDSLIKVSCSHPRVPSGSANLCYRSAQLLQDACAVNKGADIRIQKRIPVGAGLGGGSSNAAAVLLGLNKLWRLNLSEKKLVQLGRKIGADVPFFLYNRKFGLGTARGDAIKPLKTLDGVRLWHILVVPKIHVSTPLIYRKWDKFYGLTRPKHNVNILISGLRKSKPVLQEELLFNSLEVVTTKLYPQVQRVKNALVRLGAEIVLMSGSGPAVFGIVSSQKEASVLRRKVRALCNNWQVFVARTI